MKKLLTMICAAVAAMSCLTAQAVTTHRMADTEIAYTGGFITTGGVLVFPGKTLADLEGCSFWGTMGGGAFGAVKTGLSNTVKPYPANATGSAIQRYDFDIMTTVGTNPKAVHIQLYNGNGGVYAKVTKAWYRDSTTGAFTTSYYTVNASTGELTWNNVNNMDIATGAAGAGYGVRAIGVARCLTATTQLAFPGLTVAQIGTDVKGKLSAKVAGGSNGFNLGMPLLFTNAVVIAGTAAAPTAIRCEAQYFLGGMVKCAVVELSDGEGGDGVYAKLVGSYYKSTTALGMRFVNDDGTKVDDSDVKVVSKVPTWILDDGYGMYNLEATEESVVSAFDAHFFHFDRYSYLSGTAQIVFPGATLSELEGRQFYGLMQGSSIGGGSRLAVNAYSHAVTRYPTNTTQAVQKLFFALASVDGDYTKYVVVELSQATGGVQAKAVLAMYKANTKDKNGNVTANFASSIPFTVNSSGTAAMASGFTKATVATSDHVTNYGIKQLGVMNIVGSNTLVFPGLRVKDIFNHEITGRACGNGISNSDQMQEMKCFNRVITATDSTTGEITGFRAEMQLLSGDYVKCVSVRFTNGADGVLATGICSGYYSNLGDRLGRKATNDAGTGSAVTGRTLASASAWSEGYGVCNLSVALHDEDGTPATAVWNGGNPAATSSWTCKAADGTALQDTLPGKYTQIHISANVTMAADADLTPYDSVMTTAANLTINTSGHKLYVKTLEPWKATTVTDSVGGGELHVAVPEGTMTYNSQIALSGKLKLVTEGDGLFSAAKEKQAYTGGTQVASGTLRYEGAPASWPLGGNNTKSVSAQVVTVDAGATLDINGYGGFGYTTVVFNGGTVKGASTQFNCAKRLTADSYLVTTANFTMKGSSPLVLNGHTLEVAIAVATSLTFDNCAPQGPGKIKITSGGTLCTATAAYDSQTVDFSVGSALNLGTALSVHDYKAEFASDYNGGTAALNVYGTFTPSAGHNRFYGATMQDGSTIDLSARTTPLPRFSAFTAGDTMLKFADGATVNVEIGDRSADVGTCLVSWPSGYDPDLSVGFTLLSNGAAVEGRAIVVKDDGLYIKDSTEPEYAMWVDGGWRFYKGVVQDTEWAGNVTSNMQVRFATAAEYDAICDLTPAVSPAAFVLATNEFVNAEGATFDFTRTDSLVVEDGTVFDAKGGLLKLPATLAGGIKAFTVTNSAEQVGSLEVEVPENDTTTNTKMALAGNLKFVKSGAGTFIVKKEYQAYTGGTQVAAGTLMYNADPAKWPLGGNGAAAAGAQIVTVDAGATLDIGSYGGFGYTTVVFNGGTVRGATTMFNCAKRLDAYSYLTTTGDFKITGPALNLNGHTLSVAIKNATSLYLETSLKGPGTFKTTSGGWLNMTSCDLPDASVNLDVCSALNINKTISASNYTARYTADYNTWGSSAALNVYGTFTPKTAYFTAATMKNGSTIDLSAKTGTWSTKSSYSKGNTLQFEANGTVYVNLGTREMDYSGGNEVKIVSWASQPSNVKFVATEPRRYRIVQKSDGLYCSRPFGLVIFVQ